MPRGGKKKKLQAKQKKQKRQAKGKQGKQSKSVPREEVKEAEAPDSATAALMNQRSLLEKYEVRLGPKNYVPASAGTPKSFSIHDFVMMDPGGGRQLLSKTELRIAEGRRYGLVGKNGFGKTTLLKLMKNYEIEGFPRHIRMILVNQEELITEQTVLQCVLKADEVRERLTYESERLERLQAETDEADEEKYAELAALIEMIYDLQEDLSYDTSEKKAMQILRGLGFTPEMARQSTKDLSGGWQMRVKLAMALFVEPDLMLLDEPTNHLDFPTVLWLQNYLQDYDKTVIVVSHDRAFLNAVCTHTIHLTQKQLRYFTGNYDTMLKTAQTSLTAQVREFEALEKQIKEIKEWIRKYQGKGEKMASQVKSKKVILEKLEEEYELLAPSRPDKELKFQFPDVGGIDDYICRMTDVSFKYPGMEHMLLQNITMQLDMDSRIGMIGANGVGKSTLVKLVMDKLEPLAGECLCNRQARIALFTQYHIDQLNLEMSAVQFICERFAEDPEMQKHKDKVQYARRRLGRFQLTGRQHTQQMKYLSGGQKSRVAFCVATWTKPHFLIMDEPTNHLDMETIDSLTLAIKSFHGGVLLISHDQYFLQHVADEYWAVTPDDIRRFGHFDNAKLFALGERLKEVEESEDEEEDEEEAKRNGGGKRGKRRTRNKG